MTLISTCSSCGAELFIPIDNISKLRMRQKCDDPKSFFCKNSECEFNETGFGVKENLQESFTTLWKWSTEDVTNQDVGHLLRANQIHVATEFKTQYPDRIDEIDRVWQQLLTAQPDMETNKLNQGIANVMFGDRKQTTNSNSLLMAQNP